MDWMAGSTNAGTSCLGKLEFIHSIESITEPVYLIKATYAQILI
jgi:hypothetical protein